ncbi:MAG: PorT family protein [Flammeovirgaceae bacterium]|nr:PorT family protein [Flammeovirgaceae bacterium]
MKTIFYEKINVAVGMICMICVSSVAYSQVQFAVGLKGGLNFANLDVSSAQAAYDNRTGFHGGAFALFKFTKIAVQPEIIFSQQGSKVTINTTDYDANFSYMNIPILLKLYTVAGINLQLGPQFGFLTSAESDYNPITMQPESGADISDAYKNSDVSLGMGVGWDLPFGLTIDARYNLGLTEIDNSANIQATKNQVWQISAGYKLIKLGGGKKK